jgi:hypothetical protein
MQQTLTHCGPKVHIVLPNAGEGSAKRILLLFENSYSESVEQSTEFFAERVKDSDDEVMNCSKKRLQNTTTTTTIVYKIVDETRPPQLQTHKKQ